MVTYLGRYPLAGFVDGESGLGIAFRKDGEEILFASRENAPPRWVPLQEFVTDPVSLPRAEDLVPNDDGEGEHEEEYDEQD